MSDSIITLFKSELKKQLEIIFSELHKNEGEDVSELKITRAVAYGVICVCDAIESAFGLEYKDQLIFIMNAVKDIFENVDLPFVEGEEEEKWRKKITNGLPMVFILLA